MGEGARLDILPDALEIILPAVADAREGGWKGGVCCRHGRHLERDTLSRLHLLAPFRRLRNHRVHRCGRLRIRFAFHHLRLESGLLDFGDRVASRLADHVVGGDLAGSTAWSTLKALVTDLYYREDNDLVVNTPSMFGGAERTGVIRYWIDTGGGVDHFHYFKNPDTASRVVAALLRPDSDAGAVAGQQADAGVFHALEKKPSEITPEDYRKRSAAPQPIVVVLPGIMGSTLKAGDNSVWMNYLALAAGGLADLDMHGPARAQCGRP